MSPNIFVNYLIIFFFCSKSWMLPHCLTIECKLLSMLFDTFWFHLCQSKMAPKFNRQGWLDLRFYNRRERSELTLSQPWKVVLRHPACQLRLRLSITSTGKPSLTAHLSYPSPSSPSKPLSIWYFLFHLFVSVFFCWIPVSFVRNHIFVHCCVPTT